MGGRKAAEAVIEVIAGPDRGMRFAVGRGTITIGRAPEADIQLTKDMAVSTQHALVVRGGRGWFVEDMGSKNGTFLIRGGERSRVRARELLRTG